MAPLNSETQRWYSAIVAEVLKKSIGNERKGKKYSCTFYSSQKNYKKIFHHVANSEPKNLLITGKSVESAGTSGIHIRCAFSHKIYVLKKFLPVFATPLE